MELTTKDLVIGKCYRIKSHHNSIHMKADRVRDINFLAAAPFVLSDNHDNELFNIVGLPSYSFRYETLIAAGAVFEEATPLQWEADKIYALNSLYKPLFRGCFGAACIGKQDDLLRYLGERFTVKAVTNSGAVLGIYENDQQPPNSAMYVLEESDRRYFDEIGFRAEVVAKPEPLELKLRALFELQQGHRLQISNERDGHNVRLQSYDDFVAWLNKSLETGVVDLNIARRQYQENLDTINKIGETINAALKG